MAQRSLSDDVKQQIEEIVQQFNTTIDYAYEVRYKGNYVYLDRKSYFGKATPICRLKYTGDMRAWEFAIYKYSTERYDDGDWLFPGSQYVDGTIEGALKAGVEAYPA